jgi:hypothetical protein
VTLAFDIDPIFRCHLFTGRLDKDGYGLTSSGRRAHLVAWEQEHGPVPPGMQVGHDCLIRRCCNVRHLSLETPSQNLELRRGRRGFARRLSKKTCHYGHSMRNAVVVPPWGGLVCRECNKGAR